MHDPMGVAFTIRYPWRNRRYRNSSSTFLRTYHDPIVTIWMIRPRPRWQHPRWHIWHWRLQVHPWQRLRRRLFERCAACGKPFAWDESPVAVAREGKGPLYHRHCRRIEVAQEVRGENAPA